MSDRVLRSSTTKAKEEAKTKKAPAKKEKKKNKSLLSYLKPNKSVEKSTLEDSQSPVNSKKKKKDKRKQVRLSQSYSNVSPIENVDDVEATLIRDSIVQDQDSLEFDFLGSVLLQPNLLEDLDQVVEDAITQESFWSTSNKYHPLNCETTPFRPSREALSSTASNFPEDQEEDSEEEEDGVFEPDSSPPLQSTPRDSIMETDICNQRLAL